jgi:hypothetical protein
MPLSVAEFVNRWKINALSGAAERLGATGEHVALSNTGKELF